MPWFTPARKVSSFDEESARLNLCEARDLGVREVEVAQIVGSVGRWRDFDAKFRLTNKATRQRYQIILTKMREGYTFPPIHVYKVKDKYYVADGNHRVSAAKELGVAYIDAHVQEFFPCGSTEDAIYWRERSAFEAATRCHSYQFTTPDSYRRLLSHLQTYREHESRKLGYELDLPAATQSWLAEIDAPVRRLVRSEEMPEWFPGRTEDDLVLYFLHHYVGLLRSMKGPENLSYHDAVDRVVGAPGTTMMGRFRRFFGDVLGGVRDVIDGLTDLNM
jgi:hypothetical protein